MCEVVSSNGGRGNVARATIVVVAPPTLDKILGAAAFPINTTTNLNFLAKNTNPIPITVNFSDTLPAGLVIANPSGAGSNCGATVTAVPLSGLITVTASLPANGDCQVALRVLGTTPGVKNNVSSTITSPQVGTGNFATASTIVVLPPTISKSIRRRRASAQRCHRSYLQHW